MAMILHFVLTRVSKDSTLQVGVSQIVTIKMFADTSSKEGYLILEISTAVNFYT